MKYQNFFAWDCNNVANYKSWAQGFGTALTALGWTKTSDTAQVNWANVVIPPIGNTSTSVWGGSSAFSSTGNYTGVAINAAAATLAVVTSSGLTYQCILTNFEACTAAQSVPNTAQSLTLTAAAATSGTVITYTGTITGGGSNAFVGYQFVITGFVNATNNVTAICIASSTTTLALAVPVSGVAETHAGTATSSSSITSIYNGNLSTPWNNTNIANNSMVGLSFTTQGFTNSSNNTTFTITSNGCNTNVGGSAMWFAGSFSGVTETHAATLINSNVPLGNFFWAPYNFEIWQSNDATSSTSTIYLRVLYTCVSATATSPYMRVTVGVGGTTGDGYLKGNYITELPFGPAAGNGTGAATYECDFCVDVSGGSLSFIMWRNEQASGLWTMQIERARDTAGNALDAYVFAGILGNSSSQAYSNILFKQGAGPVFPSTTWTAGWPAPSCNNGALTSLAINGLAPAVPVMPMVGFVGNPLLGGIFMKNGDCAEGGLQNIVLYGSSHTYLMTKATSAAGALTTNYVFGMRWE